MVPPCVRAWLTNPVGSLTVLDVDVPKEIRASGQALFSFLTYGLGMYLGSVFSGYLAKSLTTGEGSAAVTDWASFWWVPSVGVLASLAVFVLFFRMPRRSRSTLVTKRSSPTSCTRRPSSAVSFFQPSQSSSASPSSIDRIGHLALRFFHKSIISSVVAIRSGWLLKKQ